MSRIFILFFVIISCKSSIEKNVSELNTKGMVFINGGEFLMGADNEMAMRDEYPQHLVKVNSFWMDESEVTVADFKKFVDATGYLTTAERAIDWDDLKQYLPLDTPKPHDSLLAPSSLVFNEIKTDNLNDFSQWWSLEKNVNWKRPYGKDIDINLILKHPVTHVSWDDAVAYCKWIGKRLPTEAEFEFALRAGKSNTLFTWGNEGIDEGKIKLNIWQGNFPSKNTVDDEYYYTSPVKSFEKNSYG